MPTYDYECAECGHAWELFQQITENPKRVCPACRKRKARRLLGAGAAVLFKGSGFYQTDYRSESYKKAAKADKESTAPAKPASDSKSDSSKKSTTKKNAAG